MSLTIDTTAQGWPVGIALTLPARNARWIETARPGDLSFGGPDDAYIAHPAPANRHDWLEALHAYRSIVRTATLYRQRVLELTLDQEPVWADVQDSIVHALALRQDEMCEVEFVARAVTMQDQTLCLRWESPETIDAELVPIPASEEWETHRVRLRVPQGATTLRIGLDPAAGSTPGSIQFRSLTLGVDDDARMARVLEMLHTRERALRDFQIYDRKRSRWLSTAFACHFTFMYDVAFYHPDTGYRLDAVLDDGEREFGGYDAIRLWHAYPRLGLDQRNQIDFYRDMPGGLTGLRTLVDRAHRRNVRVFVNYNPWDTGTRPEEQEPDAFLAALVDAIDADGVFLDTLANVPPSLPQSIEAARPGAVLCPEINPPLDMLPLAAASWAQWAVDTNNPPGLEHRKWIEPRHMRWQIKRWDEIHVDEIRLAFYNGSGMMIWENIFGAYNPWTSRDRAAWRRAGAILRAFREHFASNRWDPFYPLAAYDASYVYAHRWPSEHADVFTVLYTGEHETDDAIRVDLMLEAGPETRFYDLWHGGREPLVAQRDGPQWRVTLSIDRYAKLGALLAVHDGRLPRSAVRFLERQESGPLPHDTVSRQVSFDTLRKSIAPSRASVSPGATPAGMVHVSGGAFRFFVQHMRRECGCYPNPTASLNEMKHHTWGYPFDETLVHDFPVDIAPFLIDEAAVTNAHYAAFLKDTGYQPHFTHQFLAHWPNGMLPAAIADHPVVYVDIDDARAYAQWAGKRLPTEFEWHLAAQGLDGRKWPWGNEYREECVNLTGATMPARSLESGRSPYGCYHMSGNVYELTESCRTDGHTRFLILRGGSYFRAEGSIWYMDGGPKPCDHHAKCILIWPGIDRCATVGFRCVNDLG